MAADNFIKSDVSFVWQEYLEQRKEEKGKHLNLRSSNRNFIQEVYFQSTFRKKNAGQNQNPRQTFPQKDSDGYEML